MAGATAEVIIGAAQRIIKEYGGMKLTVRQIFYRLVSAQLIPNSVGSYQKVVRTLVDARKSGGISYTDIEDRTRAIHKARGEEEADPAEYFNGFYDYLKGLDQYYTMPRWWGQPKKVVVFVEKQALSSLFTEVTDKDKVDLVVCRGYPSLTLMYDVAQHLLSIDDAETRQVEFLYFGDFDPSGADIERCVADTLTFEFGVDFNINRIAITRDQIDQYHIPPAPAKTTDSRYQGFVEKEGVAWQIELDAIEPRLLQKLIRAAIEKHFDPSLEAARNKELKSRRDHMRFWINQALNPDFEKPEEDGDEE